MRSLAVSILLGITAHSHSIDYIFPLATQRLPGSDYEQLLVAHRTAHKLQIYLWDPHSFLLKPALSSFHNPLNIQTLFDGQGFSFLDNGRIRTKKYNKRSPKTLTLEDRKLIENGIIKWVNDDSYILSAWCYYPTIIHDSGRLATRKTLGVYYVVGDGKVASIVSSPHYDCLYAHITDNTLFYVKKETLSDGKKTERYSLIQRRIEIDHEEEILLLDTPCHGLTMLSRREGLYFKQQKKCKITGQQPLQPFICCYILYSKENGWITKEIAVSHVPFMGNDDTFDLFKPLILHDQSHSKTFYITGPQLCAYDLKNNTEHVVLQENERYLYAPILSDNKIYCGCSLHKNDPRLWKNENLQLCCDLPVYQLTKNNENTERKEN